MILRRRFFLAWALVSSVTLGPGASAWAQAQEKAKAKRAPDPSLAAITDEPGLPRVLLIGDSISMGYTIPGARGLAGKANLHRPPQNCGPTIFGIERLESWLGSGHWDVIHFNFGLHDLRLDAGKHQVPLDAYEKNLRRRWSPA